MIADSERTTAGLRHIALSVNEFDRCVDSYYVDVMGVAVE